MLHELTSTAALIRRSPDTTAPLATDLQRALEFIGGIDRFISPGMVVLIKPDLRCDRPEEIRRHIELVVLVARLIRSAGAYVIVADSPFADAVDFCLVDLEAAGTEAVPIETRVFYVAVAARQADLVVNLARLRPHAEYGLSGAIENVIGVLPGFQKVALLPGGGSRAARIAALVDLYAAVAPGLTILDGLEAGETGGAGDGSADDSLLAVSADGVAIDAIVGAVAGLSAENLDLVRLASESGLGIGWPEAIKTVGDNWESGSLNRLAAGRRWFGGVPAMVAGLIGPFIWSRPTLNQAACNNCGVCVKNCPTKALRSSEQTPQPSFEPHLCIGCHRCAATCPQQAMMPRQSRLAMRLEEARRRNCDF